MSKIFDNVVHANRRIKMISICSIIGHAYINRSSDAVTENGNKATLSYDNDETELKQCRNCCKSFNRLFRYPT